MCIRDRLYFVIFKEINAAALFIPSRELFVASAKDVFKVQSFFHWCPGDKERIMLFFFFFFSSNNSVCFFLPFLFFRSNNSVCSRQLHRTKTVPILVQSVSHYLSGNGWKAKKGEDHFNYLIRVIAGDLFQLVLLDWAEAGATFDNSFFDNSFGFLRQFKNRSFLDPVFVHVTGRSQN